MQNKPLFGKKILITAGGTKEKIDPVRYITNCSSGKMGIALAENAADMGADVTLVSTFPQEGGKWDKGGNYTNIIAETAQEMEKVVKENLFSQDCVIMAAAVADWRVENYSPEKMKKGEEDTLTIKMVKNPDILKEICEMRESIVSLSSNSSHLEGNSISIPKDPFNILKRSFAHAQDDKIKYPLIVGFCAESENLIENAKTKIQKKGCDFIVANDISRKDIGFNSNENEVYIIDKELNINKLEKNTKQYIAKNILEEIFNFSKTKVKAD